MRQSAATATCVVLFWICAAILVVAGHVLIEPRSSAASSVATIAVLLGSACIYTRVAAREADVTHALGVGIAWLTLSIATEIAVASREGHAWFTLLGSPERPLLRNVVLFAWVFGPALFAQRERYA
jgi:hypothetical protein